MRDPHDAEQLLRILGRKLTSGERTTFATLEDLTPEVVAVALELLRAGCGLRCNYLSERGEDARMSYVLLKLGAIEREAETNRRLCR